MTKTETKIQTINFIFQSFINGCRNTVLADRIGNCKYGMGGEKNTAHDRSFHIQTHYLPGLFCGRFHYTLNQFQYYFG